MTRSIVILPCLLFLLALIPAPDTLAQPQIAATEEEPPAGDEIAVTGDAPSDAAIAARLREIYANLEQMEGIEVAVEAGVVTLNGEVITQAAHDEAVRLARQVEGVVNVEDRLESVFDASTRLEFAWQRLTEGAGDVLDFLPLLVVAFLVVALFWFLANLLLRWEGLFRHFTANHFLADLLKQLTRIGIIVLGVLLALEILDAVAILGALLGAAGLFGLALGFALRDTIENYIATILLSLRQPFDPNDYIRVNDFEGKVVRMTSGATILMTFDGNHIRIPNALIYKGILTNYTRNPQRRFEFTIGVADDADLTAARSLALHTLHETTGVLGRPEPLCLIMALGPGLVELEIFAWTHQGRFDFLKVRSAAIEAVKQAFEAAAIAMPEPAYRLRLQEGREAAPSTGTVERIIASGLESAEEYQDSMEDALDLGRDPTLDRRISREASEAENLLREQDAAPEEPAKKQRRAGR